MWNKMQFLLLADEIRRLIEKASGEMYAQDAREVFEALDGIASDAEALLLFSAPDFDDWEQWENPKRVSFGSDE